MSTTPSSWPVLVVSAIAATAMVYVLAVNFDKGLWFDEVFSLQASDPSQSFSKIMEIQSIDASPLTYYIFLRFWRMIFGAGYWAAQSFNIAIFFIGSTLAWLLWPRAKWQQYLVFLSLTMSCVATLYYLLEIRTYSLILTIAIVAAAAIDRLLDYADAQSKIASPILPLLIALMAAMLMISLHAWGALFGGMMLIAMFWYNFKIVDGIFGIKVFIFAAFLSCLIFIIAYLPLLQVFDSRLTAAGIDMNAELSYSAWSLISGLINLVFVTERSLIIAGIGLVILIAASLRKRDQLLAYAIMYLGPIILTYIIVLVFAAFYDRLIYKSYFNIIFVPFLFMFITRLLFTNFVGNLRHCVIFLFLLANLGSIPIFERFAEQPYQLIEHDGRIVIEPRKNSK